ncbi:uncharacterized protein METZ01_LOCUS15156, partial [marine metagenome]
VGQVGVAPEVDTEHLPGLPFVPVGPRVDHCPGVSFRGVPFEVALHVDPQVCDRVVYPGQELEPLLAAGDAPFRVGRCRGLAIILPVYNGVHVAPEGRRLPVDG